MDLRETVHGSLAMEVAREIEDLPWIDISTEGSEEPVRGFTMQGDSYLDGSPASLAAWTIEVARRTGHEVGENARSHPFATAERLLRLVGSLWQRMLIPEGKEEGFHFGAVPGEPGHIDAKRAARCLRRYARTGEVRWEDQPEEPPEGKGRW